MKDIVRVHYRKIDGTRSTISLDKQLSDMIIELGHNNIALWVQRTYDRIVGKLGEKGKGKVDKSLSRVMQREALLEIQKAFQYQKERVKKKEEQIQIKNETVPLVKHILFTFEDAVQKGQLVGDGTFDKLNFLRKSFKSSAEHYRSRGWSVEDKKIIERLGQAINKIRRADPEGRTHAK